MSSAPDSSALNIDLWPKARFETDIVTPVSILRRQAALLGEKTQQLVAAEVVTTVVGDYATHFFRLVVPALDHYKYELFRMEHRVDQFYPIMAYFPGMESHVPDQQALVEWLRQVLSSESTLRKVDSPMAQAKG